MLIGGARVFVWDVGVFRRDVGVANKGWAKGFSKGVGLGVGWEEFSIWGKDWRSCWAEPFDNRWVRVAGFIKLGLIVPFDVGGTKIKINK